MKKIPGPHFESQYTWGFVILFIGALLATALYLSN
jgi:hypothetical protein